jgi:hypothetical protein
MKAFATPLVLGILIAVFLVQDRRPVDKDSVGVDLHVSSITPRALHQESTAPSRATKIEFVEDIEIGSVGPTVGDFKFDKAGNVYFTSTNGSISDSKDIGISIIKFDKQKREQRLISMDSIISAEPGEKLAWQCYDVDNDGNVYVGVSYWDSASPKRIFVLNSEGSIASRFNLPNFLPYNIAIDQVGNVWIAGEMFNPDTPRVRGARGQGQIRVYDRNGNLLRIPLEGFKPEDIASGSFIKGNSSIKFILQSDKGVVYNFSGTEFADAWSYGYQQQAANSSSNISDKQLLGITVHNDYVVWQGLHISESSRKPFIMLESLSGEWLTPENELWSKSGKYFSPAGADTNGHMYFLSLVDRNKIMLKKARVYPDKNRSKNKGVRFIDGGDQARSSRE